MLRQTNKSKFYYVQNHVHIPSLHVFIEPTNCHRDKSFLFNLKQHFKRILLESD